MSVTGVILDFPTSDGDGGGIYTVTRLATSTTFTSGRHVPGSSSTLQIAASVQPYQGKKLTIVPEGLRADDVRVIFTTTALKCDPGACDRIAIGGVAYVVFHVEGPWELDGDTHYRAYAARPTQLGGAV